GLQPTGNSVASPSQPFSSGSLLLVEQAWRLGTPGTGPSGHQSPSGHQPAVVSATNPNFAPRALSLWF
ncbi:unnamed protein product, partial [Amoebophrya sp. A120]